MPTVLRSGPYRVYFFSHDPNEPPHVHVDRAPLRFARQLMRAVRRLMDEELPYGGVYDYIVTCPEKGGVSRWRSSKRGMNMWS